MIRLPEVFIPIDDQYSWSVRCWNDETNQPESFTLEQLKTLRDRLEAAIQHLEGGIG
ncbi:hypothetical protein [Sulfobacillus harzensis]|uniref:Uncharacterized protein n=1 Tax=Sulfobacillus harzensis TaxID=2729629 RepID=A0A7Y0L6M7_9FIRM|nr:hypothetical protein [Sulfobacillus harzensis]NMP23415.1 hypothetical protein [Sulfobacillus harzensis]